MNYIKEIEKNNDMVWDLIRKAEYYLEQNNRFIQEYKDAKRQAKQNNKT